MKICPVGAELFHEKTLRDGRRDIPKLIVANSPKKTNAVIFIIQKSCWTELFIYFINIFLRTPTLDVMVTLADELTNRLATIHSSSRYGEPVLPGARLLSIVTIASGASLPRLANLQYVSCWPFVKDQFMSQVLVGFESSKLQPFRLPAGLL